MFASCPHITPTPDKKGRIFWLSGPPGTGKSTTCQLMARKNGYVYYEADATMGLINPFIDLNTENPSLATMKGKPMRVSVFTVTTGYKVEFCPREKVPCYMLLYIL